jgi:hypothetical protein
MRSRARTPTCGLSGVCRRKAAVKSTVRIFVSLPRLPSACRRILDGILVVLAPDGLVPELDSSFALLRTRAMSPVLMSLHDRGEWVVAAACLINEALFIERAVIAH